ncbi:phosphosulfolactate synthase [Lederbergia wuyishanensis]|uniref:Phosphosulfolactate synthase n=1 Tax=Lederbergia wuyishanensis TaxID=1347903 RepID=A0ABU0D6U0_9BACI|nr:phosphosulfolactate synthase [Lederbergia wuyishanensis]MCJ8008810.1 phosphosulfolactate synthase [Lederbergia wuyishanensis]MDQ0344132.1 phosphosulfolactate synthase [Lederbergia wuyishanensis]
MDFLQLPIRTAKPRAYGLTSIIDTGISYGELKNMLKDYGHFIDVAKLGMGSAYITPNLKDKIDLYKEFNITPYCGGTLFEKSYFQNKVSEYSNYLKGLGIDWIEVSTGTINIPLQERLNLISLLVKDFHVIAEVGSKDIHNQMSVSEWKNEIKLLLDAGCNYVITEGRDSGTAGIYDQNGNIKTNLISYLLEDLDYKKIIFEAPTPKQQMFFINEIGSNVNLGNVKLNDVLVLETQRRGLRCETFYIGEQESILPI